MSIIYEALKKVEGQRRTPNSKPSAATQFSPKPAKVTSNFKRILLTALAIILMISINMSRQASIPSSQPPAVLKQETLKLARTNEPAAADYSLEGIIYDFKNPWAIINGKVVKESDSLGSYSVVKIAQDRVEMTDAQDGSQLILSLDFFD